MNNVMIDLETLGTTADACILSIGAVRFELESDKIDDEGFYMSISVDSNLHMGRRIEEDTLKWWFKQTVEAQEVFYEPKHALATGLLELKRWFGDSKQKIWSNGADFDLPILAHAYSQMGLKTPWQFWNSSCFRTYKNLPGAKRLVLPAQGVKHNALVDALAQARSAQNIYKGLFTPIQHSMVKAA